MGKNVGIVVVAVAVAITVARPALAGEPELSLPEGAIYEEKSKSNVGAFVLEFVLPGAGSIYAGDTSGAITTWMLLGVGTLALGWGFIESFDGFMHSGTTGSPHELAGPAMLAGYVLILGGKIYGLTNAVRAVDRHNEVLRAQLRLGEVSMVPLVTPSSGGLAVVGRF